MRINEEQLINTKDEVFEKVKKLILLHNTSFATIEQVSTYYEIGKEALETIIIRNKDELSQNGYKAYSKKELENLNIVNECFKIPNRGLRLFSKRAILKIAFLLIESDIARQIRIALLQENPQLYYELHKENQLRFKKYETEIKNYLEFSFGKDNVQYQVNYGKYSLDFVLYNKIHIEVDENGHSGYSQEKEELRNSYILENTDYITIRYNPQKQMPYELIREILKIQGEI